MSAKHETYIQTGKSMPAIAGASIYGFTLNEVVAIVTIGYILIQVAFLFYKWYWDWQDRKNKNKKK